MPIPEVLLRRATRQFSRTVLKSQDIALLVTRALANAGSPTLGDDVRRMDVLVAEPWNPTDPQTNLGTLGLHLTTREPFQRAELGPGIAQFEYVEVLVGSRYWQGARTVITTGQAELYLNCSDALWEQGMTDDMRPAAMHFLQAWQTFFMKAMKYDARLDPLTSTFVVGPTPSTE